MPDVKQNILNPKNKPPVTDKAGHYDLDGVTQDQDLEVIVACDETEKNSPPRGWSFRRFKTKIKNWLN
jgi:hypothetical protein